jgi:hypothetical protein
MNVEIGAEAALFAEKKYINGISLAVRWGAESCIKKRFSNLYEEMRKYLDIFVESGP